MLKDLSQLCICWWGVLCTTKFERKFRHTARPFSEVPHLLRGTATLQSYDVEHVAAFHTHNSTSCHTHTLTLSNLTTHGHVHIGKHNHEIRRLQKRGNLSLFFARQFPRGARRHSILPPRKHVIGQQIGSAAYIMSIIDDEKIVN